MRDPVRYLNSRPLTSLSSDLDNYRILTPTHFLIGRPVTGIGEPHPLTVNDIRLYIWQK